MEKEPYTISVAEHVWEHMTFDDGCIAAQNCYDFLADGGYIRVAVPDANLKNEWYQGIVKVGGNGDPNHPAYTHKIVYDYKTLCVAFEKAGFVVDLLEYCDENRTFHYKYWNELDGKIGRSLRFDTRNKDGKIGVMGYLPDLDKSINKFITMSKDEYANFVEDTIQLVVKQFAEKNLLDVFDNLLV